MATAASCREVGYLSSPLQLSRLGVGVIWLAKTISRIGRLLGQRLGTPLHRLLLTVPEVLRVPEGMLPCGCTVSLQSPHSLTVSDITCTFLCFFPCFCVVYIFLFLVFPYFTVFSSIAAVIVVW